MARRYGKLPTDLLLLDELDFSLNLNIYKVAVEEEAAASAAANRD